MMGGIRLSSFEEIQMLKRIWNEDDEDTSCGWILGWSVELSWD